MKEWLGAVFYLEEEGIPPYDELIYVANPNLMDVDMVRRFIGATELATQFIINNPPKAGKYSLVQPKSCRMS